MPRRPRCAVSAYAYHVMNRRILNLTLFDDSTEYQTFIEILVRGLSQASVGVLAYCVMPNHWHLVLRCTSTVELSRLMHWITTTHARAWHRRRNSAGRGPVYKGRFLSVPLAEAGDVIRVCRYVERNPLKAGLVERAELWHWSSLADHVSPQPMVPLMDVPTLRCAAWLDHVNRPSVRTEEDELNHLEESDDDCCEPAGTDQAADSRSEPALLAGAVLATVR